MTTNPQLPEFDPNLQALADQFLASGLIDTGGIQFGVRFGTAKFTFTASAASANITVTHGLGRTPVVVMVGNEFIAGIAAVQGFLRSGTTTATAFGAVGQTDGGSTFTGTSTVPWVVIG